MRDAQAVNTLLQRQFGIRNSTAERAKTAEKTQRRLGVPGARPEFIEGFSAVKILACNTQPEFTYF